MKIYNISLHTNMNSIAPDLSEHEYMKYVHQVTIIYRQTHCLSQAALVSWTLNSPCDIYAAAKTTAFTDLYIIGIMCSKFCLNNLKTEGEVWDSRFPPQTN